MKNIYSYNEFLNEGLMDLFFKKIFSLLDKDSGENLDEFVKKIDKINDLKRGVIIFKESMKTLNDDLVKVIDEGTEENIQKKWKDTLTVVYSSLNKMSEKYKIREIKPEVLYKESTNKILKETFVRKDIKDFTANIDVNANALISELKKKAGIVEEKTNEAAGQDIENQSTTTTTTTTTKGKDASVQPTDPTDPTQPAQKIEKDPKQEKYKTESKTFAMNGLFGPLTKKLDEIVAKSGPDVPEKEVQDVAKSMRGSKNLDSKKQFLNTIRSIDDPKILGKLRDTLTADKVISKDEYDKMKF